MKRVGRAGLRGAFGDTVVCGGAPGVAGTWAEEAIAVKSTRLRKVQAGFGRETQLIGDRLAL